MIQLADDDRIKSEQLHSPVHLLVFFQHAKAFAKSAPLSFIEATCVRAFPTPCGCLFTCLHRNDSSMTLCRGISSHGPTRILQLISMIPACASVKLSDNIRKRFVTLPMAAHRRLFQAPVTCSGSSEHGASAMKWQRIE